MKTPLSPYLNKKIAIHCNNQEEWNAINEMRVREGKLRTNQSYYGVIENDNMVDCFGLQSSGSFSNKDWYISQGFQIIEASTLLHSLNPINSSYEIF